MPGFLKNLPLPLIALIVSFLCPTELSLFLGGLRLPPHRIVLLIVVPLALWRLLAGGGGSRFRAFDAFFILYGAWAVFAFSLQPQGFGGVETGGSEALDSVGGYFVARAYVRTLSQFVSVLRVLVAAVAIAGLIALPEVFTGRHFAHELMQMLTGQFVPVEIDKRYGLTRAFGVFDHPIHLGTFACAIFAFSWYASSTWVGRLVRAGVIVLATFTGLSSAPLLGIILQAGLIGWDIVTRPIKGRIALTLAGLASSLVTLSIVSSRSIVTLVIVYLTINPWTGIYRTLIWEYGLASVAAHPLIGIGLQEWARPAWMVSNSIDAYWLVVAVRMGIPAIALLALAIVLLGWRTAKVSRRHRDPLLRRYAKAWFISLIALSLVGCTVHFWNVLTCYFFFLIGLAGWIADPVRQARAVMTPVRQSADAGPGRRRRRRRRRRPQRPVPGIPAPHLPHPA